MTHNYHSSVKNKLEQIRSIIKSQLIKFDIISLVSRWDNAPHHKKLDNFPYHLHLPDRIDSSLEINLIQVLDVIKMSIIGKTGEGY